MLAWLRYRYNLCRLHSEKRTVHRYTAKSWKRAKHEQDITKQLENIKTHKWRNDLLIDDEISQLRSDFFERQAKRLHLLIPEFNQRSDKWEESPYTKRRRLTQAAVIELCSAIHTARKENGELFRLWGTFILLVIGAMVGIVHLFLGKT
jgi:hypothetical protein